MSDPVVLLSTGDVVGPAGGVTDNSMVLFSGTSGKLIKGNNAVVTAAGLALLDDVNAAAQRTTLGLGTAATATLTTSATDGTAGRVIKVGDFGLGGLNSSVGGDLNALNKTGFYMGANLANSPDGISWYYVIHQEHGAAGYSSQIAIDLAGSAEKIYARRRTGGSWTGWQEIALINSPTFTGVPSAPTASAGTNTQQLASTAFVQAAVGVGNVSSFATATPPTGWLKANGAAVNRTTYAALFAAIGTTFGAGDGSTTFNVPDLRGEFVRGWDDSRGVDAGRSFGATQLDALQNITGTVSSDIGSGGTGAFAWGSSAATKSGGPTTYGTTTFDASRVARTSTETRGRNVALLYCIKY